MADVLLASNIDSTLDHINAVSNLSGSLRAVLVFPTLSVGPTNVFLQEAEDPVDRSNPNSGAILQRAKTIDGPVKYQTEYLLGDDDKEILEDWERDKCKYGARRFDKVSPLDDLNYRTLLAKPINYKIHPQSGGNFWRVVINFKTLYVV